MFRENRILTKYVTKINCANCMLCTRVYDDYVFKKYHKFKVITNKS